MEGLGALPQRAAVGNRPRGLQRRRRCVVVLQPRPGTLARVPLGGGRSRGHQRREAVPVPRARAVERARPDPQGTPLRADERRGQPRRGREGVLLLRRQPADAQLPTVAVQVPTRRVPVRRPRRDEQAQVTARHGVRAHRHRDLRRGQATSTSRSSTSRSSPKTSSAASPCTTGRPRPRRCTCCPRCGSATRGRGRPHTDKPTITRVEGGSHPAVRAEHTTSARCYLYAERGRRALVLRERDEQPAACGAPRRRLRSRRTASTTTSCTARRRSTLRTKARRSRLASWSPSPEATRPRRSCDSPRRAPESLAGAVRRRRQPVLAAPGRGRRVLRLDHATRGR